jgi:hypothetical protein
MNFQFMILPEQLDEQINTPTPDMQLLFCFFVVLVDHLALLTVTGGDGYPASLGDAPKFNSVADSVVLLIPWKRRVFSSCTSSLFRPPL